jgi:hypothetical protein
MDGGATGALPCTDDHAACLPASRGVARLGDRVTVTTAERAVRGGGQQQHLTDQGRFASPNGTTEPRTTCTTTHP